MTNRKEQRVLITGAGGFIGEKVARLAHAEGFAVTALDARLDGLYPAQEKQLRWERLHELAGVQFIDDDLRSIDWSKSECEFEYVINLAAMPGLKLSWDDYELYRSCNLDAVERLVKASIDWPLKNFIQISTSSVYGKNAIGDEDHPTKPVSPYGVTKLAAENLLFSYYYTHNFPVSILRYFSVYGPGQRPDMAYRKFIEGAIAGSPIVVFGDGQQSRTNTYIDDVAQVTVNSLTKASPGEVYNIAGEEETTVLEAVNIIRRLTNSASPVAFNPRIPGDQDRTAGDSGKAARFLGFDPRTSIREGLTNQVHEFMGLGVKEK
jgi:UDP-glucuronate 4-epimerase